jgi:hypothetical protein
MLQVKSAVITKIVISITTGTLKVDDYKMFNQGYLDCHGVVGRHHVPDHGHARRRVVALLQGRADRGHGREIGLLLLRIQHFKGGRRRRRKPNFDRILFGLA